MEIQYDSNGDGWEIGAPYEFSSNGKEWRKGFLEEVDNVGAPYYANGDWHHHIRICQTPVVAGKKHKKHVELIEGEYYKWDSDGQKLVGRYTGRLEGQRVANVGGSTHNLDYEGVSNIKRMVEAEE